MNAQAAMTIQEWKPCAALRPFVEVFSQRKALFGQTQSYHALPARSDCFLEFYFADRYRIVNTDNGAMHWSPQCVLVGPHTHRREDLILTGQLENFTIRFSAIGFRALFGIPASTVRNIAEPAELVLGFNMKELQEKLADASGEKRVRIAEAVLVTCLLKSGTAADGGIIRQLAETVKRTHGTVNVATLAANHKLSTRHVERMFQEHVGLAPKTFGRLARISKAVKLGDAGDGWAEIAAATGYFDQSHMVREFQNLVGETPVGFAALRRRAATTLITKAEDVAFVLSGNMAGC